MNFVVLYRRVRKDMLGSDWLQTFSCLSKAKIDGMNFWRARFADKHSKTPLAATTE